MRHHGQQQGQDEGRHQVSGQGRDGNHHRDDGDHDHDADADDMMI